MVRNIDLLAHKDEKKTNKIVEIYYQDINYQRIIVTIDFNGTESHHVFKEYIRTKKTTRNDWGKFVFFEADRS